MIFFYLTDGGESVVVTGGVEILNFRNKDRDIDIWKTISLSVNNKQTKFMYMYIWKNK